MGTGIFGKIRETKVSFGGQYFEPGYYKVRIKGVKLQDSQVGVTKQFFIVETVVMSSDNPKISVDSERSQVIPMDNVMALPNIKAFIAAASGVDPSLETINEEVEVYWTKIGRDQGVIGVSEVLAFDQICEMVVSAAQPLTGLEMDLECIEIITKEEKKPFTKHVWKPRVE